MSTAPTTPRPIATTIGGTADLTLTKSHSGSFTQGQTGATYTIAVTNSGTGSTSGAVTVSDTVPAGLTPTAAAGSGWTCTVSGPDVSCTRSDALAAGQSYPAITLTVNVAANATNLTNTATVAGGGDVNTGNNSASDATTIGNGADLTLAKTHSGSFVQGQTGATYTLTAANAGGTATVGAVTVSDTVPAGLTPTAAAGNGWTCTLSGQDVSCTRSDALAAGQSYPAITLTVNVAANATNLTNTATVSGGGEVNTGNNSASDATTIGNGADLTLSKTHSGSFVQGQTGATYTLTAANSGGAATAGAVTVSDAVPAGLTPTAVSGTGWTCAVSGQDVSCTRGDALAAGQSYPAITLTVDVAANATNLTNTATVSGGGDLNTGNDTASDPTTIAGGADLTLSKTHSGSFLQGQTGAAYTLTVTNLGASATNGVVTTTDVVPTGLTPTAASGPGWTCGVTGQDVACTRSDALAPGQSYPVITLTVTVAANATNLTNTATVAGGGDGNSANNSASDATTIAGTPDLTLTKSHSGSFTQGQIGATYTLAITNSGTGSTSGLVTVSDTIPAGLTPTAALGSGWTCTVSGQDASCTRSDALAAGQSYPAITLTVNVAANATNLTNTASVAGGGDVNTGNNSASDATTISSGTDLTLSKTHAGSFLQEQIGAAYTLTVTNSGTSATSGAVTISDAVPAGLTPTAASGSGWTCTVSGQDVGCSRSDVLAAGQSYPAITLTVNVAANATNVTNTASVSGGGDVNLANNSASDATTIGSGTDLTLSKTHSGSFVQGQAGAIYMLTAMNSGGTATTGMVTVSDTVPAGLTPTAAAGSGWTCSVSAQDVSCTRSDALAAGQSYPAITLTVNVAANATNLTNTASVSGGGDVNPANNSASDATTIGNGADLTLSKTHSGSFAQGQTGAIYTLTATNSGGTATAGVVTVNDTVPAGLTPTAAAGSGWTCTVSGQDMSCTRSDALAAGQSYPAITLTVNVAADATNLTNTATIAGGGDVNPANNSASDATTIGNGSDLTLSKTHSGSFIQGQTGAIYTLTVVNAGGTATLGDVTVSDTVPAGLTPTAAAGSGWTCTVSAQDVNCTRSDALAAGQSYPAITLTVNVGAQATNATNTATVSGGGDVNTGNNSASDATTIGNGADLTLSKTHTGNFIQGQTGATYTITVVNAGGTATFGAVTVSDAVPAGLTPTAAAGSGWTCTVSAQDVSCTRSDALAAGQSYPAITLAVNVAANATNATNIATVSGGGDVNTGNNSASDVTTIGNGADLTLSKTHSGSFAQGLTGAIYTLTVVNAGGTATFGAVSVSDAVPAGLTPTAAAGSGWTCTVSGQDMNCTRSDALAAGQSYPPIALTVNVAANAASSLTNVATVAGGGDANLTNNTASDQTTIASGTDLTIAMSHDGAFRRGQIAAAYRLTVANVAGGASSGLVTVVDAVPAGLTPTAATGSGWACGIDGQSVSCTRNDALATGQSYPSIVLTVNVGLTATDVTNVATVSGGGDTTPLNNRASDPTTIIVDGPDLTIAKSHAGQLRQSQAGAYSLVVTNRGPVASSGLVTVIDVVPNGLTPTAATGTDWACAVAAQEMTCTRSDALGAGQSFPPIVLSVMVAATATDLTNTATVSGGGDVNPNNNSAADTTTIAALSGDLVIEKRHEGAFVRGQVNGRYTIVVRNLGPGPSDGMVTVIDTLPAALHLVSAGGDGWICTAASCWRSDVLAANAAYPPLTVRVTVDPEAPASVINTASLSGGGDLDAANNVATDPTEIGEFTAADFQVAKSVDKALLRPGDSVAFRIEARNVAGTQLEEVRLTDTLPRGLTYVRGTARVAMTGAVEPPQAIEAGLEGPELSFAVGRLAPSASAVIHYTALVSVDARAGRQDSELRGAAMSPLGGHIASARAQVAVIVMPSSFAAGQVAIGRVFHDADNDGEPDAGERGIANVRVLLPSGSSAITGRDGLYNLPALPTGAVVIAVDPATLPAGYHVRRTGRGDGRSQLQRTPLGSGALLTQNFPVIAEPGAAPLAVVVPEQPTIVGPRPAAAAQSTPAAAAIRTLSMTAANVSLPADGRARTVVTVTVADANGAPGSAVVQVRTSAGQLLSSYPSDVAPSALGGGATRLRAANPCATPESGTETPRAFDATELDVIDGQASVCLVSDLHPGVAKLIATSESVVGLEAIATITFEPVQRAPLLVGVGEVSIGAESGANDAIDPTAVQARGQLFFQDTFAGGSQLTVALNSEGPINTGAADRLFQLDPLERAYPVFGDSSTRQELAQSNAQVYARFDRGRSHIMFGDLRGDVATPGRSGLGDVSRNLTGFRVHAEPNDVRAFTATVSRPDTAFRRDVISGPQFGAVRLSRGPVLLGSETVTVEVRDRRNPEVVLRRELLNRSVDYLLDPLTGVLYLNRTLQQYDDVLNVTNLVVTYDYQVAGLESAAYSGRARTQFGQLQLRGSAFAQERGGTTFSIGTFEAEHALPRGGRWLAEVPVSHGAADAVGDAPATGETRTDAAWRVLFEQPFERGHSVVRGQFQRIGEHFLNPYGSPAVAGSAILSGTLDTTPIEDGTLTVTVRQESNDTAAIDNDRLTVGTRWTQGLGDRFEISGGVDHRRYADRRADTDVASYLLTGQAEWRPIERVTALVRREQNLADADPTYPNQTVWGGSYQLSRQTKLFVTQRFSAAPIIPISGFETAGLLSPLSTRETSIGVASAVSSHTDVTSKFQLDRGLNGTDAFALVGTRTRVPVRGGFGIDWGVDHAQRVRGDRPGYTSGTVGVAYVAADRFRSAMHYELRSREVLGHALTAGAAGRLSPGVTVLVNYRLADLAQLSPGARESQTLAALAWRPTSDRYGLLFSWNQGNRDAALLAGQGATRVGRLSTDGYLAPGKGLELHSRLALIRTGATVGEMTSAYLWQGRIQQRLLEYLDVAVEQRSTWQTGLDLTRTALAAELGVWALPDLRLGLGYRTRPVDSNGLPVLDAANGGGFYFVMTSRLAGFFNLLGRSSAQAAAPMPPQ